MEHAETTVQLEDLYKRWEDIVTKPYTITSIPRPRRFKPFWDHRLDQMGKKRSRLYKKACQTGSDEDWSRYKSLNKRIKKMVKKKKQDTFKEFAEGLLRASPSEATATINRITKAKKGYQAKHTAVGKSLTSEVMTQHIRETFKSPRNIAVILEPFEVTQDMENEIVNATGRAPLSKAPGPDLVIGESLRAAYKVHGKFLVALWKACGRLAYTPSIWSRSIVVPIFKKGDKDDPANYRPIALLSHARKIIESALDSTIRKTYKFHRSQYGFQLGIGTEAAILRAIDLQNNGHKYAAILDLKAAYDRVPRDKLISILQDRLPEGIVRQILPFLTTGWTKCVGANSTSWAEITRGVPQGSPMSPTLFNVFMDVFAERIEPSDRDTENSGIILFADDVQLTAKSRLTLQQNLDTAFTWAIESEMKWNVRKCSTLLPEHDQEPLRMGTEPIQTVESETYLGVTITRQGITDKLLRERV